jgi:hypothetical protein
MEKTKFKTMRKLFKTSNENPYKEFRQICQEQYDKNYGPFDELSFNEFYEEMIDGLLEFTQLNQSEEININEYKCMRMYMNFT